MMNRLLCLLKGHDFRWHTSINEKKPSGWKCERCGGRHW